MTIFTRSNLRLNALGVQQGKEGRRYTAVLLTETGSYNLKPINRLCKTRGKYTCGLFPVDTMCTTLKAYVMINAKITIFIFDMKFVEL